MVAVVIADEDDAGLRRAIALRRHRLDIVVVEKAAVGQLDTAVSDLGARSGP